MNMIDHWRFRADARRYAGRGTFLDLMFLRVRNAWINWRRKP